MDTLYRRARSFCRTFGQLIFSLPVAWTLYSAVLTSPPRAMMHDPETFDSPLEFNPERYLKDGQIDPSILDAQAAAFGFGRRSVLYSNFPFSQFFSHIFEITVKT